MNPYQQARAALPNMPEEIFALWLDSRIKLNGWPPQGPEWNGYLYGMPLHFWAELNWTKQEIRLSHDTLAPTSKQIVRGLIDANVNDNKNKYSEYIPDTKARFESIMHYIMNMHDIPSTLVLLATAKGFQIVEGSHRVSVLIAMQQNVDSRSLCPQQITAWVGEYIMAGD